MIDTASLNRVETSPIKRFYRSPEGMAAIAFFLVAAVAFVSIYLLDATAIHVFVGRRVEGFWHEYV
jgi:hypothetical protein